MRRYHLENPKRPGEKLEKKGQSWDEPIYKGRDSNDFFMLKWTRGARRALFPYDPDAGTITGEGAPVSDNWGGEPRVLGIDREIWDDLRTGAYQDGNAERLMYELLTSVVEGDTIRVTEEGRIVGYIRAKLENGQWILVSTGGVTV